MRVVTDVEDLSKRVVEQELRQAVIERELAEVKLVNVGLKDTSDKHQTHLSGLKQDKTQLQSQYEGLENLVVTLEEEIDQLKKQNTRDEGSPMQHENWEAESNDEQTVRTMEGWQHEYHRLSELLNQHRILIGEQPFSATAGFCNSCGKATERLFIMEACGAVSFQSVVCFLH